MAFKEFDPQDFFSNSPLDFLKIILTVCEFIHHKRQVVEDVIAQGRIVTIIDLF